MQQGQRRIAAGWACLGLALAMSCLLLRLLHPALASSDIPGIYEEMKVNPDCASWLEKLWDKGVREDEIRAFVEDLGVSLQGRRLTRDNFDEQMLAALVAVGLKREHVNVASAIVEVARESGLGDVSDILENKRVPDSLKPLRDLVMRRLLETESAGAGFAPATGEVVPQGAERKWFGLLVRSDGTATSFHVDPGVLGLGYASGRSRFDLTPYTGTGHAPDSPATWQWEVVFPGGELESKISARSDWVIEVVLGDLSLSFPAPSLLSAAGRRAGEPVRLRVTSATRSAVAENSTGWATLIPVGRRYELELAAGDGSRSPEGSPAGGGEGPWRIEVKLPPGYVSDPDLLGMYTYGPEGGFRYLGGRYRAAQGAVVASLAELPKSFTLAEYGVTFDDTKGHWAEAVVRKMAARHVVKGIGDGKFSPDAPVTRAQGSALVQRTLGLAGEPRFALLYEDVLPESWYAGAVGALARRGAVAGARGRAFRPDEPMTREELAAEALGAAEREGVLPPAPTGLSGEDPALWHRFSDWGSVSPWARVALARAVELGVMVGRGGGRIEPQSLVTRAEAVAVLCRLLGILETAR